VDIQIYGVLKYHGPNVKWY